MKSPKLPDARLANPFLAALNSEAAKGAGLRYFSDARPGIRRKRHRDTFAYFDAEAARVKDSETLARIKRLAIPPAWTEVWICPVENGHIQATGRDARGRKQYRYHPQWRATRDQSKFERMIAFASALPKIRRHVNRDIALPGMPREKVLATLVRLLETTLIRVGNDEYARHNRSYGLTTLHNRHVKVVGPKISFAFKGKSGKAHEIALQDRELARVVRRCQDLPGQELFAYIDEAGKARDVTSQDVNEYLREITGQEFTAKDFRTWAGTVLTAVALRQFDKAISKRQAKKNIGMAMEAVARVLGNTPAICRKCYVHPDLLALYLKTGTVTRSPRDVRAKLGSGRSDERMVAGLLKEGAESVSFLNEQKTG